MAYARFGEDSDVYIYLHLNNNYICCNCGLNANKDFDCQTPKQMIAHLIQHHIKLKHKIPKHTMYRLQEEYK